jgi:protein-tyrosine phosphatase
MSVPIIFWIENEGAGRLAILARPQGDEGLAAHIEGWKRAGIDVVVSLLTQTDNANLGLTKEGELCRAAGLKFISYPLEDFGVPASMEGAHALVKELHELLANAKNIGFHCNGCIGRAPLIASCVLMMSGETAEHAYELVSIARGYPIPEARAQAEWGKNFEREIRSSESLL